jgi:hypothetical protein
MFFTRSVPSGEYVRDTNRTDTSNTNTYQLSNDYRMKD